MRGNGAAERGARWSPLQQLGRTSLFIYWIHVEMVYGLISLPIHMSLTLRRAWALVAFSVFMLVCSIVRTGSPGGGGTPARSGGGAANP